MRPAVLLLLAALPLTAWGDRGHRIASGLALSALPQPVRAWYAGQEEVVLDHASDPDHWRADRKEGPRHFLDVESYGGLDALPRTTEEARTRLGGDFTRSGTVPWIVQDRWLDLVEAFRAGDGPAVVMATAILGHYIADLHVPLHTTSNHDGQATNQKGVHRRWESGLVERFLQAPDIEPLPAATAPDWPESPWNWLRATHALVPQLLEDDRAADRTTPLNGRESSRTQAYWMIFWARQGPTVKRQLQLSGKHLGDTILMAWIVAGRPAPLIPTASKR